MNCLCQTDCFSTDPVPRPVFGRLQSCFLILLTYIIYILYVGRDFDDSRRHFYQNLLALSHNEHDNDHECYISQSNEIF